MKATHTGTLSTPSLPSKERICHTFPAINKSLFSESVTCDEGGEARLMKEEVHVAHNDSFILKVKRDTATCSWIVPMWSPENSHNFIRAVTKHSENISLAVVEVASTNKELVRFLNATYFYPIKCTWKKNNRECKSRNISRTHYVTSQPTYTIGDKKWKATNIKENMG